MPPAVADAVYRSVPPPRQKRFPARLRYARRPAAQPPRLSKQQTLTQIDGGVSLLGRLESGAEESEPEFEDSRPKKRRRRGKGESQKTLTQIGWVATVPSSDIENDDDDEGNGNLAEIPPSDDGEYDEYMADDGPEDGEGSTTASEDGFEGLSSSGTPNRQEEHEDEYGPDINQEDEEEEDQEGRDLAPHRGYINGSAPEMTCTPTEAQRVSSPVKVKTEPPKTPRRIRKLEIPSSQSPPVTPLSAIHTHERRNGRSPLRSLSTNAGTLADDTPSKSRQRSAATNQGSSRRQARVKEEPDSQVAMPRLQLWPMRSHISDSVEASETEDEDQETHESSSGLNIGQETQAIIHKIDIACRDAQSSSGPGFEDSGAAENGGSDADEENAGVMLPMSSATRSFDFDQHDVATGQRSPSQEFLAVESPPVVEQQSVQDKTPKATSGSRMGRSQTTRSRASFMTSQQPSPAQQQTPYDQQKRPQSRHSSQDSTVAGTAQRTPRTQRRIPDPQTRRPTPSRSHQPNPLASESHQALPQSSHPSQISTVAGTTQQTQKTQCQDPGSQSTPPPEQLFSSSPFPMPPSLSSPVVADSQRHVRARELQFGGDRVITATQLLPDSWMDYSLPPPPLWPQTQTQETVDEDE